MKQIEPIQIWNNGTLIEAVTLNAFVSNDNLLDSAIFGWGLYSADLQLLSSADITMSGQDYTDWNSDPDINTAAYNWIAQQLGLTII